jgi:hypothetical protein
VCRYGPGTTYNDETTNGEWYGPRTDGTAYALDSSQPYTVVTQFHAGAGGAGELQNITRFYMQKGERVDLPTIYVVPPTDGSHMRGFAQPAITNGFCTDIYDRWSGGAADAPLTQMGKNMDSGVSDFFRELIDRVLFDSLIALRLCTCHRWCLP